MARDRHTTNSFGASPMELRIARLGKKRSQRFWLHSTQDPFQSIWDRWIAGLLNLATSHEFSNRSGRQRDGCLCRSPSLSHWIGPADGTRPRSMRTEQNRSWHLAMFPSGTETLSDSGAQSDLIRSCQMTCPGKLSPEVACSRVRT
jgi:hypothetical protein